MQLIKVSILVVENVIKNQKLNFPDKPPSAKSQTAQSWPSTGKDLAASAAPLPK